MQTPEQAQKVLHATHALQTQTQRQGDDIVVEGAIVDLETQTHVRNFSYRYSAQTVGALADALAGEVSAGLGLRGSSVADTLSASRWRHEADQKGPICFCTFPPVTMESGFMPATPPPIAEEMFLRALSHHLRDNQSSFLF